VTAGRPRSLVVVTGTGTEVGKTWVSCSLLALARARGLAVAARKPVQSYAPGAGPTDSALLAAATGEPDAAVGNRAWTYAVPLAPPMAAEKLGAGAPGLADLAAWLQRSWPPAGPDLAVVEGAGGVASPLAPDGDTADLARALGADVAVVVAEAALGVISSVRLAVGALAPVPAVVHLNRFDPADDVHAASAAWLRDRDGFVVTTTGLELLERLVSPGADPGRCG
jgi:dethiobiotin synthetase